MYMNYLWHLMTIDDYWKRNSALPLAIAQLLKVDVEKLSRRFMQLIPISVPFIPPSCRRCYENPQARLYPHITLHCESSAEHIGTAFILVSHVEATQAAGRQSET